MQKLTSFNNIIKTVILTSLIALATTSLAETKPTKTTKHAKQAAPTSIARATNATIPAGALNGVAYSVDGKPVQGYNQDMYFRPASTLKILTALAGMIYLGGDYQIKTALKVSPNAVQQNKVQALNGVLNSNVEIEFRGDPTLTVDNLQELFNSTFKKQGIRTINGNLYLNSGYFAGHDYASGWSWNDLTQCFAAPPSSIILNGNCVYAKLIGTSLGGKVAVDIPQGTPITIDASHVEVVTPKEYYGGCELEVQRNSKNIYVLSGCMPVQKPNQPLGLSFAIQDPEEWGKQNISRVLARLGIKLKGQIIVTRKPNDNLVTVASYNSKPLSELLRTCLYMSKNLIADTVAKTIGHEYYQKPATYAMSALAIRNILQKKHIDLGNATIIDGSGLSAHNYITPRAFLNVLNYIATHDHELNFIQLLPVAGQNGTVQGRGSIKYEPLVNNVTAKTGTINGVSNLAGFMKDHNGRLVPFVYFMNNISYDAKTRSNLKAKRISNPQYPHERMILEHIYDGKRLPSPLISR